MTVAVLMSTYNGEKYLLKQINSILQQKNCRVSLIVRDDGSKDKTKEILEDYRKEGKLSWYDGENLGPAKSFTDLLFNCGDYEYYAFSDQDDIWDDDKLSNAVRILEDYNQPACYYCNARLMDMNDVMSKTTVYSDATVGLNIQRSLLTLLCTGGAMGCTMVLNHAFVDIVRRGGMPDRMIMHDCFLQALCKAVDGIVIYDAEPHMGYRQHNNNVVGRKTGILNALKYRVIFLSSERSVSIADHAAEYIMRYACYINEENKNIIFKVVNYRKNLLSKMELSMAKDLELYSLKNEIFIRISLLLGKR